MLKSNLSVQYQLFTAACLSLAVTFPGSAWAQSPATGAQTASAMPIICFLPPAKLADDQIQGFLKDPSALLNTYPSGGLPLSNAVRSLAGSSSEALDPLLALVTSASKAQTAAIGSGLARAAKACASANAEYAALIQTKVAELNDEALSVAFVAGLYDVQTAALGGSTGGAGAAAGIGGGGDAGGGGSGGLSGDDTTPTTSGNFGFDTNKSFFSSDDAGGSDAALTSDN